MKARIARGWGRGWHGRVFALLLATVITGAAMVTAGAASGERVSWWEPVLLAWVIVVQNLAIVAMVRMTARR